ncbi:uncharacterized protein LOC136071563 [Quercus suber]|uniref:uncharacterized protein LOC136071563 n=1 Tax=Quercus suber TaxID=58331 RepID=UPI0032E006EC
MDECQKAFQDLKSYLTTTPLLSSSVLGEELYLYLAVSPHAVSLALIREEGKVQKPVYYTSRALRGAKGRYPLMKKLAFALVTASRKLRHYFQAHVINVMTDHLLKKAMNKLEAAGRLIQWPVELSEFDVRYRPRNAIKAQALADLIAEFTPSYENLDEMEGSKKWVVHVDVEYEALLKGLEIAKSVEADSILVLGDSQLVIDQVNGTCEAKEDRMKRYLKKVVRLMKKFKETDFVQIPREENIKVDTLAKEASMNEVMDEFDEIQYMPSIDLPEMLQIEGEENLITLIISYLKDGRLPEGKDKAKKLRVKSAKYILMDEVLYKRDFFQPYLRCLASDEANYVLREVHEGACGNHSGARSLVHKVIHAGYYWPTIQADAKAYVKANRQVEVAKGSLLKIIKTRLEGAKGVWPDELPGVLWAYRTTVKTPMGEIPFKLAYESEAVIPTEVHMASHRVIKYQDEENKEQLHLNLDLLDEVRIDAEQRLARRFNIGDLILKRVSMATKNPAHGKLGPNWEGPYRIINYKRRGSYYLEVLDGQKLEYPWNVEHMRRYYQ